MTDSNGYVQPSHLAMFAGVQVSKVLVPLLTPVQEDFEDRGYTFRAALPWGGYRPYSVQAGMKADPGAYGSTMSADKIAEAGSSTHGFGLSFDLVTTAPLALAVALMAEHGFSRPIAGDPNHFQPNGLNVLASPPDAAFASLSTASSGVVPITEEEEEMFILQCDLRGQWLVGPGFKHHLSPSESGQVKAQCPDYRVVDTGSNSAAFDLILNAHTVPSS